MVLYGIMIAKLLVFCEWFWFFLKALQTLQLLNTLKVEETSSSLDFENLQEIHEFSNFYLLNLNINGFFLSIGQ